jgi:hypothetical protein
MVMIKKNEPILINQQPYIPDKPIEKPKWMLKVKKREGNKLIFQKSFLREEKEGKGLELESETLKRKEGIVVEEEDWLEKEDKEIDAILINKEGIEKEKENEKEKKEEEGKGGNNKKIQGTNQIYQH